MREWGYLQANYPIQDQCPQCKRNLKANPSWYVMGKEARQNVPQGKQSKCKWSTESCAIRPERKQKPQRGIPHTFWNGYRENGREQQADKDVEKDFFTHCQCKANRPQHYRKQYEDLFSFF